MSAEPAAPPKTIECYEPATLAPLGTVAVDTPADVRRFIEASSAAQQAFGAAPVRKRLAVLRRVMDHLLEHADELCEVVARDSGKTLEHAMMGEIWPVCEKIRWTLANAEWVLKDEKVRSGLLQHKSGRIVYAPRGVIGVICPWNYPLQNIMGPAITALAAGNGVIIKVSEWVAWSSERFQAIFDEALQAEGFDPALVRLVNGYGDTGAAVVTEGTHQVVFTGCLRNGRKVAHGAAEAMIPAILELGGKDPYIVCEDADLDRALHGLLVGTFINAGQNCLSSERILVHEAVYERFEAMVIEAVSALRCGPPLAGDRPDVGAVISPLQLELVDELVQGAVAEGATVAVGGKRLHEDVGQFYAPTVLTGVRPDMKVMNEEMFGPVVLMCRVKDDDEAIAIANGTDFGLGSTIISKSASRARALAERIQAGSVMINDFGMNYMIQDLPFGGVKASGHGRLNGVIGLRGMTSTKAVIEDRVPFNQPAKVFPVGPNDYATYRAAIRTVYGKGAGAKVGGVSALLGAWRGKDPHGE